MPNNLILQGNILIYKKFCIFAARNEASKSTKLYK